MKQWVASLPTVTTAPPSLKNVVAPFEQHHANK